MGSAASSHRGPNLFSDYGAKVVKRNGHPTNRVDGYDFGLRVKVKSIKQSMFNATSRVNGDKVTIKEIHLEHYPLSDAQDEISLLAKLSHHSIPRVREVFITDNSYFLVFDFIDTIRLKNYIDLKKKSSQFSVSDVRSILKGLLSAVIYCHDNRVIIRSLTPDNILVKKAGTDLIGHTIFDVRIVNFSAAISEGSTKPLCDHPLFEWSDVLCTAPEALQGNNYSPRMDVWSLGVLVFLMISGTYPFYSDDDRILVESIKQGSFTFDENPQVWNGVNDMIKRFVGSVLQVEPNHRPSAKDLQKNHWIIIG